ncbi:efflux RND transporter periplasmic adaptor subunit [Cohnella luojiensis]|uniref:efflux RND transporter periplasmic adaptor subunit n=1 Tax=Cohnella luojiensis TaxID=652876 RepID=UPI001F0EAFA5|nr:efflux RND transporter periplasmic adaptor subunit [Cohnella luojiensis]
MHRTRPTKHRLHRFVPRAAGTAVLLAATLALAGCSLLPDEETLQPPLIQPAQEQFDAVDAAKGDIQTSLRGNATFVSAKVETLSFKGNGGRLKSINVKLGDQVKSGDLLAELETGDLDLQLKLQRLNVERAELLYKQALMSDANDTELRLREIDLERENISYGAMESRLSQAQLYAQISGTVIFVESLKTGDGVNTYQSIITIADPSSMQLSYAAGNAKDLLPLEVGMPVSLKYKGKDYTGKVLQSPSTAPVTDDKAKAEKNETTIILSMDNQPEGVHVGDVADVTIELQKRENVIVLPRSAVRTYMGRFYVQVAEGDRRKEVDVEVGLTTPTQVEIVQGLKEGQKVILNN